MKLSELKLSEFINEVDSSSPAPGGGSVSALASSLGVALLRMVGHLTTTKKKFKELDPDVQNQFLQIENDFISIKEELITLIDKDTDAFNLIMSAYKLPKETEAEKEIRNDRILEGTIEAIKVPFRVAELSLSALEKIHFILKYGNKNTLSDIAVSTLMLYSGLEGAILNVKINIPGLKDVSLIESYNLNIYIILKHATEIKNNIIEEIHESL